MSLYTTFLKLIKPQDNEYYNVEHFNHNSELIDGKLKEHDTALTTIQQGATNEQKGIVQFGTEEGKALEGMMLARLAGAYGFGGDIQNPGVKNQNYIYYDNNTRKMYKCLNQNSDTSANVQNYIPMDNFSILDRLENLFNTFKVERYKVLLQNSKNIISFDCIFFKIGNLVLMQGMYLSQKNTILKSIPEPLRPKKDVVVMFNDTFLNQAINMDTITIKSNGDVLINSYYVDRVCSGVAVYTI